METIQIYGDNRFEKHTKMRQACRGIVMKEGNILLTYEVNTDQWFIPGGGLEGTESKEDCCMRELAEETGFLVEPLRDFFDHNDMVGKGIPLCTVLPQRVIRWGQ